MSQKKFLCGRKGKYVLNFQGIYDAVKRMLDISLIYSTLASDLLSFEASPIEVQLQQEGFLAPRLCIFGDNSKIYHFL